MHWTILLKNGTWNEWKYDILPKEEAELPWNIQYNQIFNTSVVFEVGHIFDEQMNKQRNVEKIDIITVVKEMQGC